MANLIVRQLDVSFRFIFLSSEESEGKNRNDFLLFVIFYFGSFFLKLKEKFF